MALVEITFSCLDSYGGGYCFKSFFCEAGTNILYVSSRLVIYMA